MATKQSYFYLILAFDVYKKTEPAKNDSVAKICLCSTIIYYLYIIYEFDYHSYLRHIEIGLIFLINFIGSYKLQNKI